VNAKIDILAEIGEGEEKENGTEIGVLLDATHGEMMMMRDHREEIETCLMIGVQAERGEETAAIVMASAPDLEGIGKRVSLLRLRRRSPRQI
jgi:hypothetical protein